MADLSPLLSPRAKRLSPPPTVVRCALTMLPTSTTMLRGRSHIARPRCLRATSCTSYYLPRMDAPPSVVHPAMPKAKICGSVGSALRCPPSLVFSGPKHGLTEVPAREARANRQPAASVPPLGRRRSAARAASASVRRWRCLRPSPTFSDLRPSQTFSVRAGDGSAWAEAAELAAEPSWSWTRVALLESVARLVTRS